MAHYSMSFNSYGVLSYHRALLRVIICISCFDTRATIRNSELVNFSLQYQYHSLWIYIYINISCRNYSWLHMMFVVLSRGGRQFLLYALLPTLDCIWRWWILCYFSGNVTVDDFWFRIGLGAVKCSDCLHIQCVRALYLIVLYYFCDVIEKSVCSFAMSE